MASPTSDLQVLAPGPGISGPRAAIRLEVVGRRLARLRKLPLNISIPGGFLILMLLLCFVWPYVYTIPPSTGGSVLNANLPLWSHGHIFGTDSVGNDIFSRLVYGGQVSLEVGAATQVIGLVVGGALGMIAGYSRGIVEVVITRVLDVLIAFPSLVLALAIAEGLGPSEWHVIWAISFFSVPAFARITRGATLRLRDQTFMVAAGLMGVARWRILLRHLFPNMIAQLVTFGLLGAGIAIILEGALSFLSLGIPAPGASWGNMIANGQNTLAVQPSLVIIPSLFLLATVASLNVLGDGLRRRWGTR
jgi:peptide/nickel transport system permease protein